MHVLSVLQAVPPSGNTTFEVVFLARQDGNVENTLYIHTSQGSFKYQVSVTKRYFIQTVIQINKVIDQVCNFHHKHYKL